MKSYIFLSLCLSLSVFADPSKDISEKKDPVTARTWEKDEDKKIIDTKIRSDLSYIEDLQVRLATLQVKGVNQHSYGFAKAAAYLTAATEEYYDHDRTGVTTQLKDKAEALITQLEKKEAIDPYASGLDRIENTQYIRDDLWKKLDELKGMRGWPCCEESVARAEVALQWAGNEIKQKGFDSARKEIALAEELTQLAIKQEKMCLTSACMPQNKPAPAPFDCNKALQALVNFENDKTFLKADGKITLKEVAQKIKDNASRCEIKKICVEGHASVQGNKNREIAKAHNQWLSDGRAKTSKTYLNSLGLQIPMEEYGCGDGISHDKRVATLTDLQALLDKDRRVEFKFKKDTSAKCGCGE